MTIDRSRLLPRLALGRVLVCDGAMGTMLHSAGTPLGRPISALNVTRPRLVHDLHAAYVAAGADIVQTNTFDANRARLADTEHAADVAAINIAGARLAREAAQAADRPVLVAGSVGPARGGAPAPQADETAVLGEQVAALADWVDLIVLETFGDIASLTRAVEVALGECGLPVVAQMTFGDDGRTLRGEEPTQVAAALRGYPLAAVGANCTVGPAVLQDVVAGLAAENDVPVVVQPNAGIPRGLGRGLRYAHNTAYFAAASVELVAKGARVVGGCCGTTPGHIRAIAGAVADIRLPTPVRRRSVATAAPPAVVATEDPVTWPRHDGPVVLVGLAPPRGSDVPGYIEQARAVTASGADMLAVLEPDPSTARVNPISAAVLLRERTGTDVVVQIEAAGRSLAALQADVLGAHALGLRFVLCRTGSLRVAGDYPDPGSAGDVDSRRLISALAGLNDGVDWRGVPMPERTRFVIGASLCVSAADRAHEVRQVVEKVRTGAHFLMTDVVYDAAPFHDVMRELRARDVTVPVIAAVAPFRDARTIVRLTYEFPEVLIPETALAAFDAGRDVVTEAMGVAEQLLPSADGVLVFEPRAPEPRMADVVAKLSALSRTP
jgi:methionine synthase / methylenetetrahydrofolate reductase(NADPH)